LPAWSGHGFGASEATSPKLDATARIVSRTRICVDETGEAVVRPDFQHVAGLDLHHGFDPAEGPRVVAALRTEAHDVQTGHDALPAEIVRTIVDPLERAGPGRG
jgi:hypothetical protein